MIRSVVLLLTAYVTFSSGTPCKKLYFFGNNIQNKAVLSPVIVVGQVLFKMPFGEFYNATIEIKTIVKGSLGDWKKTALVASAFSTNDDSKDLCRFTSNGEISRIYFLQVLVAEHGEYRVIMQPEIASRENIEEINKTICNGCVESPRLFITEQSRADNSIELDCITESKPLPIVKWLNSGGQNDKQLVKLRNGARLVTNPQNSSTNVMYICTASNVVGESTTNVIIKGQVLRCAINDKLLCNDHGKCYKDTGENGKMFCRCDTGFTGSRCSNNPNKLTSDYLVRSTEIDSPFCYNNGQGYLNVITKRQFCLCKDGFSGQRCSVNKFKGRSAASKSMDYGSIENTEIKEMINQATKKVALKYIIIGGAIVLVGCIIVLAVIIIMWKSHLYQSKRKMKQSRNKEDYFPLTNNIPNGDGVRILSMMPTITPPNNVSPKPPHIVNHYDMQASGNGLYEGVNVSSN